MGTVKHVSVTPKGGDVLEVLKFFEARAKAEGLSLPEVVIPSDELVDRFSKQMINSLISAHFLRVD